MEGHLQKLVEHAEMKFSRIISLNGNESRIKRDFMLPVTFPSLNCSYEMALTKLETYIIPFRILMEQIAISK